jgi:hypothetical protein
MDVAEKMLYAEGKNPWLLQKMSENDGLGGN